MTIARAMGQEESAPKARKTTIQQAPAQAATPTPQVEAPKVVEPIQMVGFRLTEKGVMDLDRKYGRFGRALRAIHNGSNTMPKLREVIKDAPTPTWFNQEMWRAEKEGIIEKVTITA